MRELGYDRALYLLPFDHRGSYLQVNAWEDLDHGHATELAAAQAELATGKYLVYEGFREAVASGVNKEEAGILVDEQFGAAILRNATAEGYLTVYPVEKGGQEEFAFQYGEDFGHHIENFNPTFVKAHVRFNPEGDVDLNRRQLLRLKQLSGYVHGKNRTRFMLQLSVSPTMQQLGKCGGDKRHFGKELRCRLTIESMQQLQGADIEPDVWMLEGFQSSKECQEISATARCDGRDRVGCIVFGSAESADAVRQSLTVAAATPGFIGFAVGRTLFWEPLADWHARQTTREIAVGEISRRYSEYVRMFEAALARRAGAVNAG